MALARFDLELSADRAPAIVVNGEKLALNVVGLTVRHAPPSLPQLILELAGEITVTGEGIVALAPEVNEVDYLRSFLANLDPGTLEKAALDHLSDGVETTGQAFLAALLAMVGSP